MSKFYLILITYNSKGGIRPLKPVVLRNDAVEGQEETRGPISHFFCLMVMAKHHRLSGEDPDPRQGNRLAFSLYTPYLLCR